MARIVLEALGHPPEPRVLPPLPADAVGAGEVVALLRRVLSGGARMRLVAPPLRWTDVYHGAGLIAVEGWWLRLYRGTKGIRYLEEAVAPDGRRSGYDLLSAREGDPYALLEDDEQERLADLVEALAADSAATRMRIEAEDRVGFPEPLVSMHRILAWAGLTWGEEPAPDLTLAENVDALRIEVDRVTGRTLRGESGGTRELLDQAVWLDGLLERLGRAADR
jgi:hypothetical protein